MFSATLHLFLFSGELVKHTVQIIEQAKSYILSTHRQCDGDGLGSQLAFYFALLKTGKPVRIVNVDATPYKYRYLRPDDYIQYFEEHCKPIESTDLAIIFDTNDERMIQPLYDELKYKCNQIIFVDHHPLLKNGPIPPKGSLIDIAAASTGELTYDLIKELHLPIDQDIARCVYTSIAFDTQLFRFVRNSPKSHLIAAELLNHKIEPEIIHRYLFGNQTISKMRFLAKALGEIEYYSHGRLAVLKIRSSDLIENNLLPDEARDVIDMIMNIESLEAAAIIREDGPEKYKLSLRSKGKIEVLSIAEHFNGGGHLYAAGAFVLSAYETIKSEIVEKIISQLSHLPV